MAEYENVMLGKCYEAIGDYAQAIESYEAFVRAVRKEYGDDHKYVYSYIQTIYFCYHDLLAKQPTTENLSSIRKFMEDKCFVIEPVEGGVAAQKGLSGECLVLHYFDWTIENDSANFFDVIEKARPLAKSFVVFNKEGKVQTFNFEENTIGVQFYLTCIDPDKKAAIVKVWKQQ